MEKKKNNGVFVSIMTMSVLPLLLFGIVVTVFSVGRFRKVMNAEVENELSNIAEAIQVMYDQTYPGDYSVTGEEVIALLKGETEITGNYDIIDAMSEETGMEISLFYQDTRMLTTLKDPKGQRLIGTGANASVMKQMEQTKEAIFYDRLSINGEYYFVYYSPLQNTNGYCFGMLAIARPAALVNENIRKAVWPILLLDGVSMVLVGLVSISYAGSLSKSIRKLKDSLDVVAKGNLLKEMDYSVLKREDEIGEIAKSVVSMQRALRVLIEKDTLTEMYNRRYAQGRLRQTMAELTKHGSPYCVAIGDIDFFKSVNDTYGHEAGDAVLKMVSKVLRMQIHGKGFVARWGGEEFLLVFENCRLEEAAELLDKIRREIENAKCIYNDTQIDVTMTLGCAEGFESAQMDELLVSADDCLYEGKKAGRNRIVTKPKKETETE